MKALKIAILITWLRSLLRSLISLPFKIRTMKKIYLDIAVAAGLLLIAFAGAYFTTL
jgi:hypothetical protein